MNTSLRKLRKKYVITASVIVFFVIILMVTTLNFLMMTSYINDRKMIEGVIEQAAVSHLNQPMTEHFDLIDAEQTENGDYRIPRNVKDISEITINGNISCKKPALWYSGGGGLLFEAMTDDGLKWFYKDYSFSREAKSISISFDSYDNIKSDYDNISINESQITGDCFLVSVIWWKKSSNNENGYDDNVEISIDSIDIKYKSNADITAMKSAVITHGNFSDIFENYVPEILNNTGAFYLVADDNKRLLSINNGNLMNPIDKGEAENYIKTALNLEKENGRILKDGIAYRYNIIHKENLNIIIFVNDSFTHTANGNLIKISIFIGVIIFLILFILIVIISGYVVKPVADSIERQKRFISDASHELKTPITVISATIDIIMKKRGKDCWTECIKEQAVKMQSLVQELLDLSRLLENNMASSEFKVCNISNTINNSLLYFESLFFESGKILCQDVEDNIEINCDENKITRLIDILLDNAMKYSDDKSEIKFSLKKVGDNAVIQCSNPCSDFSASDTSKLFERFFRSENDRIHEQEGFGLGLAIAQAITELHGGKITADYKNNIITFTITLNI